MFPYVVASRSDVEREQLLAPSVIVIGGGISGIAAARALCNASFKVVIRNFSMHLSLAV